MKCLFGYKKVGLLISNAKLTLYYTNTTKKNNVFSRMQKNYFNSTQGEQWYLFDFETFKVQKSNKVKKYISNFSFTFANQFLVKIHKPKYSYCSRYSSLEHRKLFLGWKNIDNPKVMRRSYSHIQVFVVRG